MLPEMLLRLPLNLYQNDEVYILLSNFFKIHLVYAVHSPKNVLLINLFESFKFTLKYTIINVTQYTSAQSFLFLSKATCFD